MKKFKSIIWLVIACLVFCVACSQKENTEKDILKIQTVKPIHTQEEFYEKPETIARFHVKRVIDEYFTNPDGTKRVSEEVAMNVHVTRYELEIKQIYKGELPSDTIKVKIYNGANLSADLYLYGEDETQILAEPLDIFELQVGKEYIAGLTYCPEEDARFYADDGGYSILYGKNFCFEKSEDGKYENMVQGQNHMSIDPDTLESEIEQHLKNVEKQS